MQPSLHLVPSGTDTAVWPCEGQQNIVSSWCNGKSALLSFVSSDASQQIGWKRTLCTGTEQRPPDPVHALEMPRWEQAWLAPPFQAGASHSVQAWGLSPLAERQCA